MKLFVLNRIVDESGISGTGIVAEGVQFTDGTCAMRWVAHEVNRSTAIWDDIEALLAVHGHGGSTRLQWLDR